jgi:hypothetical protein
LFQISTPVTINTGNATQAFHYVGPNEYGPGVQMQMQRPAGPPGYPGAYPGTPYPGTAYYGAPATPYPYYAYPYPYYYPYYPYYWGGVGFYGGWGWGGWGARGFGGRGGFRR